MDKNSLHVVAIVQARFDSQRLPGKVLKIIYGKPMLLHTINRLQKSKLINQIVVATSEEDNDQPIRQFCQDNKISCFSGSKEDVLDRYLQAAKEFNADVVVRITGDCPLIDPFITDKVIQTYLDNEREVDYVSNVNPPTFPDGLDTEVFSRKCLEKAANESSKLFEREHVTPFIVQENKFRKINFANKEDFSHMRWVVDYVEDAEFIEKIYENLQNGLNKRFGFSDIKKLLEKKPEICEINRKYSRNDGFLKSLKNENINPEFFKDQFKQGLIEDDKLYLRKITLSDANQNYLSWLQNPVVNRYLESRHGTHSIESLKQYVSQVCNDANYYFLAVVEKINNKHVGNVKVGPIDQHNKNAYLGILIGDKDSWGKGFGSASVKLATDYCFKRGLHKVFASIASNHIASIKTFEKASFTLEATIKEAIIWEGAYYNKLVFGKTNKLNKEKINERGSKTYNNMENINTQKLETSKIKISNSLALWEEGEKIIPCGTQTASKGPDQFVKGAHPIYIQRGEGSHVFDVDGNEYIDYPCALGTTILGHGNQAVVNAIHQQANQGINFSLMHPLEVDVAKTLVQEIPCAESVRFVKNGSDATSAAIRIARASTGRDKIASCGYHGWQDWFVISTEKKKGVPAVFNEHIHKFEYNKIQTLSKIFEENHGEIAAVIMEPVICEEPTNNFLQQVRELAHQNGAVLIFDEMVTGFRFGLGGAQKYFGVTPDIGCFGKCVANGMPLSIIAGKKEYMDLCHEIFLSLTFGGEAVSLAAAKATLQEIKDKQVVQHIWEKGRQLHNGLINLIQENNIPAEAVGFPPRQNINFRDASGFTASEIKTLFLQETIKRGALLGNVIFINYSHTKEDIEKTLLACKQAFKIIRNGLDQDNLRELIEGEIKSEVFRQKSE